MTGLLIALTALAVGVAYRVGKRNGWRAGIDDAKQALLEQEEERVAQEAAERHARRVEGGRKAAVTRRTNAQGAK